MKKWLAGALVLGLGFLSAVGYGTTAQADTINWNIQSFSRNQVNVKFYSMNRNNQWPTITSIVR